MMGGWREKGNYGVNTARKSRKRGKKERGELERGRERKERGKRVLFVCQSVPGRLAENSGHVRPCEAF